jgi:hypothetical protein
MAVNHQVYSVSSGGAIPVGPGANHAGRDVTIQNLSSAGNVYLGGIGVTTENFGYRLEPKAAWSVELKAGDIIYAIADSSANIAVFMLGLESFD